MRYGRFGGLVSLALLAGCGGAPPEPAPRDAPAVSWAIAIHGGAGVIARDDHADRASEYEAALATALRAGTEVLDGGGSALDAVSAVVTVLEDDPKFNAGRGAVFSNAGRNELDAAIMDGATLGCGAVTGVTTVRHPILLARKVMEESRHVFFSSDGAERFADRFPDLERVDPGWFATPRRREALERARAAEAAGDLDTVGAVARDTLGRLAAATSTGGLTNKRFGRIGDVPVIGAGTYADDTVAVSCTGVGEQFIRNVIAHEVSAIVRFAHRPLPDAADAALARLDPGDGGLIAVGADGTIAMRFNTGGMFRGAADSSGRFDVGIWESTTGAYGREPAGSAP